MKRQIEMRLFGVTLTFAAFCFSATQATICAAEEEELLTAEELSLVKAAEAHRVDVISRVYGTVVSIYGNTRQGGGSGVLFDPSGLALTNHHVVAAAGPEGWAGLADGRLYRWKLIGTDPGGDVAMIQLTGKEAFPYARLGNSDTVRVGDFAMAMGNPFVLAEDQQPTVTLGIVSGIERYQPGAGLNMLVYGNCIQIDSSINPGNSGGPLFNMRGEVIGVNGRGSFQERGRVNVGLGYAISINQVKNFIPDLLATKVAQHGTLDALFGDRSDGVICETMNLDAPVAQAGLRLGDRLVSFEGIPITRANQFTNIISTLPADWPAELVYERGGEHHTIWVRLYALPYQTQRRPEVEPEEDEPDDDGEQPRRIVVESPGISIENAGEIRDPALNRQHAGRLMQRWKQFAIPDQSSGGLRAYFLRDDVIHAGQKIAEQEALLTTDGRFRVRYTEATGVKTFGFDGKGFWADDGIGNVETLKTSKALLNPQIYWAATLATLFDEQPLSRFGNVQLDGSDKSQRQAAYRLKTLDDEGDWFYVWLSLFGEDGNRQVRLLKSGPDRDADDSGGATVYDDWRVADGVQLPFRRTLVKGLAESDQVVYETTHCEVIQQVTDTDFQKPTEQRQEE